MNRLHQILRWIRCITRSCGGDVVSEWHTDGYLWMAWQCRDCGCIKHAHRNPRVEPRR